MGNSTPIVCLGSAGLPRPSSGQAVTNPQGSSASLLAQAALSVVPLNTGHSAGSAVLVLRGCPIRLHPGADPSFVPSLHHPQEAVHGFWLIPSGENCLGSLVLFSLGPGCPQHVALQCFCCLGRGVSFDLSDSSLFDHAALRRPWRHEQQ